MKADSLVVPVEALDPALAFFSDALRLPLRFRDGRRYAALDAGGLKLALVAQSERIVESPSLAFRASEIGRDIRRCVAAGATVLQPLDCGPHELRAVLRAPSGLPFVLTARRGP